MRMLEMSFNLINRFSFTVVGIALMFASFAAAAVDVSTMMLAPSQFCLNYNVCVYLIRASKT